MNDRPPVPVRIVVVEDEHIVALDIKTHLQKHGYEVPGTYSSGEDLLANIETTRPDVVLMDIKIQGEMDGLDASKIIKEKYGIPVILLTAFADEATIERAKIIEPFGYIMKPFEEKELRTAIVIALYRHGMEKKLKEREALFSTTLSSINDSVIVIDNDEIIEYLNPPALKLVSRKNEDLIGKPLHTVLQLEKLEPHGLRGRSEDIYEFSGANKKVQLERSLSPLIDEKGERKGSVLVLHDITEQYTAEKALQASEEMLRHSQKMDAIGRLAGGIAHDFNNLLTVIMGYSKLIVEDEGTSTQIKSNIEGIRVAAMKSVTLTRQLLAFSRFQVLDLKSVKLNRIVREMEKIIRRLVSEETSLHYSLEASPSEVFVDQGQIEQVLINLVVNARDAMENGGRVSIRTGNITLSEPLTAITGVIPPGTYVTLTVKDSGCGIPKEIQTKIFDPFFTTKESGRGTGLGLSTVYGIIHQSKGFISVESEPLRGTVFQVYLPLNSTPEEKTEEDESEPDVTGGTETILLVEDEEPVRELLSDTLSRHGYHVIAAQNAGEAILICEENAGRIHLLVTDIFLPYLNGPKLAARLQSIRPELRVLFISGYPFTVIKERNLLQDGDLFLQKPFEVEVFVRKVHEILDS